LRILRVMRGFIRQGIQVKTTYGMAYAMRLVNVFVKMVAFYVLWSVLYESAPGAFPVSQVEMVTYGAVSVMLGEFIQWWDGPHFYIITQIRRGTITSDLVRPVYFPFQVFSRCLGESLAEFITVVFPAALVAYLVLPISLPATLTQGLYFALSLAQSYLILFGLNCLVGFIGFYTLSLRGIQHAYHGLIMLLSGAWVPLWFFPSWLRQVAEVLPFRGLFFTPLSIYIGELQGQSIAGTLLSQTAWIAILLLGVGLAWRVVHSRLVVQGG